MTDGLKPLTDDAITQARKTLPLRAELGEPTTQGLRLRITRAGGSWSLMSRGLSGDRQRIALGSWPEVSVEAARAQATAIHRRLEGPNDGPVTIEELIDEYELFKGSTLKRSAGTMRAIRSLLDPYRPRHPAGLSPRELAAALREKSTLAPSQANRQLAYVRAMFNWALSQGMIDTNPAANLPKPARETPRERTPTLEEVARIWMAVECRPAPYSQIVRLLILTGCRLSEVANMRASELMIQNDMVGDVWTIPAARSKNGQAIRIPLSTEAKAVIDEVYMPGADYVFSACEGGAPFNGWQRAKAGLDRYMVLSGAEIPHWTHHDLRRAFATYACDELGCSRDVVDRCLNHIGAASSSTVSRVYIRSELFTQRKAALQAWGTAVAKAVDDARPSVDPELLAASMARFFKPLPDLTERMAANKAAAERRMAERAAWNDCAETPARLEASRPAPEKAERADSQPSVQPRWMKHGAWLELAKQDKPRQVEGAYCFLGRMRRQLWWRAIAQWAEIEGLPCHRDGEVLFLRLTALQLKKFLWRMDGLGVGGAADQAEYTGPGDYLLCAWFDGSPDVGNGFDETDKYFQYARAATA